MLDVHMCYFWHGLSKVPWDILKFVVQSHAHVSMVLIDDIITIDIYSLQVKLDLKYVALIRRSVPLENQASCVSYSIMKAASENHTHL